MVKLHIPANLPLMWDQQRSTLHSFQVLSAFYWLHFLSGFILILPMKSCNPFPLVHTILAKHQAFAPSGPIWLYTKFKFIKVEFSLRPSAKAWQEKSGRVQLLNQSNSRSSHSPLASREFLRLLNQGHYKTCKTQSTGFAWFWYATCFLSASNFLTFAH